MIVFLTSLTVSASEPIGPESLEIPYQSSTALGDTLREADEAMMDGYLQRATTIAIGQVVAVRPGSFGNREVATLLIEEPLRGEQVGLVEFTVPQKPQAGRIQPSVIEGYQLLVFLDSNNTLLDDEGLFFLEGGFAWRNRTDRVFLRPSVDRVWAEGIDPTEDYVTFPVSTLRDEMLMSEPPRRWWVTSR
ncbi:MAG: hypothetical protein P8R54_05140 [Myxococcota bacterium]|nr:hypothetical protein [Myxococcota bacterium]